MLSVLLLPLSIWTSFWTNSASVHHVTGHISTFKHFPCRSSEKTERPSWATMSENSNVNVFTVSLQTHGLSLLCIKYIALLCGPVFYYTPSEFLPWAERTRPRLKFKNKTDEHWACRVRSECNKNRVLHGGDEGVESYDTLPDHPIWIVGGSGVATGGRGAPPAWDVPPFRFTKMHQKTPLVHTTIHRLFAGKLGQGFSVFLQTSATWPHQCTMWQTLIKFTHNSCFSKKIHHYCWLLAKPYI